MRSGAVGAAMAAIRQARKERAMPPAQRPVRKPRPVVTALKVGRNEPCPCGIGRKFKKCCVKA